MQLFILNFADITKNKLTRWQSLLSKNEQKRLDEMSAAKRREEFVVGHTLARFLVARFLKKSTDEITLENNAGGALLVKNNPHVFLSLSHSNQCVAIAVGVQPVGIDMEYQRMRKNKTALLKQLGLMESAQALQAGGFTLQEAFYRVWTKWEAEYKLRSITKSEAPAAVSYHAFKKFQICVATSAAEEISLAEIQLADIKLS